MTMNREGGALVVEGELGHGIYPTHHEEVDDIVVLRGKYNIRGGIYARRIEVLGEGIVHGPIVTREDLFIDQTHTVGCPIFLSGLTAPKVVRNQVQPWTIDETCVTLLNNARMQVRGPIIADQVHLTNAVVIGNIHARQVTLEACVVFGIIECEETLVMNCCNFVAYHAGKAVLQGRLTTWLGYGISHDGLAYLKGEASGHVGQGSDSHVADIPGDIRYLPICLTGTYCDRGKRNEPFEFCYDYHTGNCPAAASSNALMPLVSLLDMDFQVRVVRKGEEDPEFECEYSEAGTTVRKTHRAGDFEQLFCGDIPIDSIRIRDQSGGWMHFYEHPPFCDKCDIVRVLSITGRILNAELIEKNLREISDLARNIAFYPHLDDSSRAHVWESKPAAGGARQIYDIGITTADIQVQS